MAREDIAVSMDPITFEVLRGALESICNEMGITLARSGLSMVINQGRDFSGTVLTRDGELVMQGEEDLPGFCGIMHFVCRGVFHDLGAENLHPGDVIITNDPYKGGSHRPDVRMLKPVFWDGEMVAILGNSGHWSDVGGAAPGSFVPTACDTVAEGLCIPPIKIVEGGKLDEKVERMILANVRLPLISAGDIRAMISSLNVGEKRMHELLARYGPETVLQVMEEAIAYARRLFISKLAEIPKGTFTWTDYIDGDPGEKEKRPIPVHLKTTITDHKIIYDFSGSGPQARGGINGVISLTTSALFVATKAIFPDIPVNQGIYHSIEVIAPQGSIVNAKYPAPVSGMAASCYEKIVSCVVGCFSQAIPDRVTACSANIINFCLGGMDTRKESPLHGDPYVMYCWSEGGYGGRPDGDSECYQSIFASGTKNQPIEIFEQQFPIIWEMYEFYADSGGPGKYRGGPGVWRKIRMSGERGDVAVLGDREDHPPWGLFDGKSGHNQGLSIGREGGGEEQVGLKRSGVVFRQGELLNFWSGGGGGYGDPLERNPDLVLEDVKDGFVTLEGARRDYGVVIEKVNGDTLEFRVDHRATGELREKQRGGKTPSKVA